MNLQVIKSTDGKDEYVLLPIKLYKALHSEVKEKWMKTKTKEEYVAFDPADYIDNPVALSRIRMGMTQADLAKILKVSQAYISKLEKQDRVSAKMLNKVKQAIVTWGKSSKPN